jgi:hypothetical protein
VGRIDDNVTTTFTDIYPVSDTVGEPLVSTTDSYHCLNGYMRFNRPAMSTSEVHRIWASPQVTQIGAKQLYYGFNQITRAKNRGDSVILPIANVRDIGVKLNVVNKTPYAVSIYPAIGQSIDDDPINQLTLLEANLSMQFKMEKNKWMRIL